MASVNPDTFQNNPLDIASLPKFEEVAYKRLSRTYFLKRNISTTISLIIFLTIAISVNLFYPDVLNGYFPLLLSGLFLLFSWSYFSNYQWYKRSGYSIRDKDMLYKRGFLVEKITVVPFNRVQHVSTNRGLLDKILQLSTLEIFTAGGSGSDISIPGLSPDTAASLKNSISARIKDDV